MQVFEIQKNDLRRLERMILNIYFPNNFKMDEAYFQIDIATYLNIWMGILVKSEADNLDRSRASK